MGVWCLYGALLDFGSETPWRSEGLSVEPGSRSREGVSRNQMEAL